MNEPEYVDEKYILNLDGSFTYTFVEGNTLLVSPTDFGVTLTPKLYKESTGNIYIYRYTWSTNWVEVVLNFDSQPDSCKILIQGHLSKAATFKLPLSATKWFIDTNNCRAGDDNDGFHALFDWSDIKDIATFDETTKRLTISVPKDFVIDPYTIGSISVTTGIMYQSPNRNSCYGNGYHWVTYNTGSYMVYRSSTDLSTWGTQTNLFSCNRAYKHGIGKKPGANTIGIVNAGSTNMSAMTWRTGTLGSGTISLGTAYTVTSASQTYQSNPITTWDSTGTPWVGWLAGASSYVLAFACKASNTSGTAWGTATNLKSGNTTLISHVALMPLGSGKMVAFLPTNSTIYWCYYNGTSWNSATDMSDGTLSGTCAVVSDMTRDVGFLVYQKQNGSVWDEKVVKVTGSGTSVSLGSYELTGNTQSDANLTASTIDTTTGGIGNVETYGGRYLNYIFRNYNNGGYYDKKTIVDEGSSVGLSQAVDMYETLGNGNIVAYYFTGTTSPYSLKVVSTPMLFPLGVSPSSSVMYANTGMGV